LGAAQRGDLLQHLGEGGERACYYGIEGLLGVHRFDACVNPLDVSQSQRVRGVIDEADLFARRIYERKPTFRIEYGERQAGEAGTCADVRYGSTVEVRLNREAVEEVVRHHVLTLGDGREVVGAVPPLELVQELQQARGVALGKRDAHILRVVYETMRGTQKRVTVRLLLVEDDAMIGEAIRTGLKRDGFTVDWVHDGESADQVLRTDTFDLLLLDLGLPRKGGLQVLQGLRARQQTLPVLIITARDAVSDRVQGLDAGADDYLVKPFDLDELAARIRALLRRKSGRTDPEIEHLGVALNPATHRVTRDGREVSLSPKEFALLQLLMERPGNILSRTQIEERLYGWGEEVESNAVEVHIHGLRRKLGVDFILNVRGVGYRVRPAS
jgi:DNA-binding response OmpR family regulator